MSGQPRARRAPELKLVPEVAVVRLPSFHVGPPLGRKRTVKPRAANGPQLCLDMPDALMIGQIRVGGFVTFDDAPERGQFEVVEVSDYLVTIRTAGGRLVDVDRAKLVTA